MTNPRLIKGKAMEKVAVATGFKKQSDGRWIQKHHSLPHHYLELMVDYDPNSHDYDFVVVLWTADDEYEEAMTLYAFLRVLG